MGEITTPPKRKGRPSKNLDDAQSMAMWRLFEGEPVTIAMLAAVAGVSDQTVYNRIAAVKAAHPDIRKQLTEDERKYIANHYGDRSNPAICDWLEKQGIDPNTHRRLDRR